MRPRVEQITIAGPAAPWGAVGLEIDGGRCRVGAVELVLSDEDGGAGIARWSLSGAGSAELDGLPTDLVDPAEATPAPDHPLGAVAIDHMVAFTPELERTVGALEAAGIELRRRRDGETLGHAVRQAFFRLGEPLLEVVEHSRVPPGPAAFWGMTLTVADIEAAAALLGDRLGTIRDAVQSGRRIATVREEAGLGMPVALITPDAGR